MEVFRLRRHVTSMAAGSTLRIISQRHFRAIWTVDNWTTTSTIESNTVGFPGSFADLPTPAEQAGQLSFTLFWPEENRWEGRNFDVQLQPVG
jgi:glucoamylase